MTDTSKIDDRVGRDLYVALLREKVPGVRVGKVVDGAVVWEDGGTGRPEREPGPDAKGVGAAKCPSAEKSSGDDATW